MTNGSESEFATYYTTAPHNHRSVFNNHAMSNSCTLIEQVMCMARSYAPSALTRGEWTAMKLVKKKARNIKRNQNKIGASQPTTSQLD